LFCSGLTAFSCRDEKAPEPGPALRMTAQGTQPRTRLGFESRTGLYYGTCRLSYDKQGPHPAAHAAHLEYAVLFESDKATLTVRRLQLESQLTLPSGRKYTFTFDSAMPEPLPEDQKKFVPFAASVVANEITYVLDDEGRLVQMGDSSGVLAEAPTEFYDPLMMLFGTEGSPFGFEVPYRLLLSGPRRLLPDQPVGAGARWDIPFQLALPSLIGSWPTRLNAEVTSLRPDGQAVIAYDALAKITRDTNRFREIKEAQYQMEGTWTLDLDRGHLVGDRSELKGQATVEPLATSEREAYTESIQRSLDIRLEQAQAANN
jgi:hypothetical protein